MSYLASPIDRMSREYDVVVVGSGYGGAITASRLARAGLSVCILERGEEFQPGDFPEGPTDGLREIQMDMPDRRMGSPTALFDFHINTEISVLTGCGLGGTSLINANVAVRPDDRVWLDPVWPEAIRPTRPKMWQRGGRSRASSRTNSRRGHKRRPRQRKRPDASRTKSCRS
jgi:cholesterol oxidase